MPFSSNGLRECIREGAERIGWRERRRPNGMEAGAARRGIGMALCNYKGGTGPTAEADVRVGPDGRAVVAIGNGDVGQGSETVLAQMAAAALGAPLDRITLVMAVTATPPPAHATAPPPTTLAPGLAG